MPETPSKEQIHSALLMNLILSLQVSAMQNLGKMKSPSTDKIEKNLEQARMNIDILDMLKAKTVNNLKAEEEKLLGQVVSELKLTFVEESEKGDDKTNETDKDAAKKDE